MENEKNYNFFIIGSRANGTSEKNDDIEVIVTSALGQGKYDIEEIKDQIKNLEKFSKESGGYLKVYQDDGENFWSVYSSYGEKLDIGSENDKYVKWDEIRNEAKQINIKNLIDIAKEQELLLAHDEIVFQFPLQWFSSPASLKSWFDKVLSYNWAYGENYNLAGKTFRVVLTTGGVTEAYQPGGQNGITFDEVLKPIQRTVGYIKGVYAQPFFVNGVYQLSDEDLQAKAQEFASTFA